MRKMLSLVLSLFMLFTAMPVAMIGVSADSYDYYTVLDADTYQGTIGTEAYSNGVTAANNISITNGANPVVSGTGSKAFKVLRTSQYDISSFNYYDSVGLPALAQGSVGFRVWIAAEPNNTYCVTDSSILAFAFDSVTKSGETVTHNIYATANWDNPYMDELTYSGAWYTFMWGEKGMNTATNYTANNRLTYSGGASTENVIDEEFLNNLQGIYISFKDIGKVGSAYYIDNLQFIYPNGEAPSPSTSPVAMKSGASIRLGSVNGIRFYTTVNTAKLAELKAINGNVVELGTLIAPADLIEGELTHSLSEDKYVDVPYDSDVFFENGDTFVGSVVSIKDYNIGRKFIGRGYIKVTNGNNVTYYYATQNDNQRSLKSVSIALKNDLSSESISLYNAYKSLVDEWASATDFVG